MKRIFLFSIFSVFALSACNDMQELGVDFGERVLITESEELVESIEALKEAVNDQTISLAEKIAAIEKATREGLATVAQKEELMRTAVLTLKSSVESGFLTEEQALGQINMVLTDQTTALSDKLSLIQTELNTGFAKVATAEGQIMTAINTAGVTIAEKVTALGQAVTAQTTTLSTKLFAIETANKAGFANVAAMQDLIITAIQSSAGTAAAKIDSIGTAVKAQTTSFGTKIDAIEAALSTGLADVAKADSLVKVAVTALTNAVKAGTVSDSAALDGIKTAIGTQAATLSTKLDAIRKADSAGFADINTAVGLVKAAVDSMKVSVAKGNTSTEFYLTQLVTGVTSIQGAAKEMKNTLDTILSDNGITIASDKSYMYVVPDVWGAVELAGEESQLYKSFLNVITQVTKPVLETKGEGPGTGTQGTVKIDLTERDSTLSLRANKLRPQTDANGKTVLRVTKVTPVFRVSVESNDAAGIQGCMYNIRVYDARGDYQVWGGADGKVTGSRAVIGEGTSAEVPTSKVRTADIIVNSINQGVSVDVIKIVVFTVDEMGIGTPALYWPSDKK